MKNRLLLLTGFLTIFFGLSASVSAMYCFTDYDATIPTDCPQEYTGTINTGAVCTSNGYVLYNEIDFPGYCTSNGYVLTGDVTYPKITFPNLQEIQLSGQNYILQANLTGEWLLTGGNMQFLQYIDNGTGIYTPPVQPIDYDKQEQTIIRGIAIGGGLLLVLFTILYLLRGLFVKIRK